VWSASRTGSDENVTYFNSDLKELILKLKNEPGKDIFIDGGAALVTELMKQDLIDRYILSLIPVFIGSGIRLFKDSGNELGLELARCSSFSSGLVQLWYNRKR
jgi:dihydrofolate reductase